MRKGHTGDGWGHTGEGRGLIGEEGVVLYR